MWRKPLKTWREWRQGLNWKLGLWGSEIALKFTESLTHQSFYKVHSFEWNTPPCVLQLIYVNQKPYHRQPHLFGLPNCINISLYDQISSRWSCPGQFRSSWRLSVFDFPAIMSKSCTLLRIQKKCELQRHESSGWQAGKFSKIMSWNNRMKKCLV